MRSSATFDTRRGPKALGTWVLGAMVGRSPGALARAPRLHDGRFETTGRNPYFVLEPGRQLVLEGEDGGQTVTRFTTVLRETRSITLAIGGRMRTVRTRVVEERERKGGDLVEISRKFFAICARTNDVVYFGADVDCYENGQMVGHAGSWLVGTAGARPCIIVRGDFGLGSRLFQQLARAARRGRAEHVRMGVTVDTPFGVLEGCLEVRETPPHGPASERRRFHAPGIGLVADTLLRLVDVMDRLEDDEPDDDD